MWHRVKMVLQDTTLPSGGVDSTALTAKVHGEQVRLLYASLPLSLLINVVNASLLAFILWGAIDTTRLLNWLVSIQLVTLGRGLLLLGYRRMASDVTRPKVWIRGFRIGVVAVGLCWGVAGWWLFIPDDVARQAFLALVLAGMSAGALSAMSADRPSVLAFMLLSLLPLLVQLMVAQASIQLVMSVMVLLFLASLISNALRIHHTIVENLCLRMEAEPRERMLRQQEERYRALIDTLQEGFQILSHDWRRLYINDAAARQLRRSRQVLLGELPEQWKKSAFFALLEQCMEQRQPLHVEQKITLHDGSQGWFELSIQPVEEGISVLSIDITARKEAEEEINRLAFHDSLTRLPNRRLLFDRLQQALRSSVHGQRPGALLFIDLDDFKTINDTLGHGVGDLLLREVANRLAHCVRQADTVARQGGDEFVVLLEALGPTDEEAIAQAERVAEKIRESLLQPYQLAGHHGRHCTASIGIALFMDAQASADQLFKQADIAMYQAKQAGRNAIRFFDPQMQASIEQRSRLETELRQAVQQRQFVLHYQVQVDHDGQPLGAEILLRWHHPERGLIAPAEFIPLAEETGLIIPIGEWLLEEACWQLKKWEREPDRAQLHLAINVSARQFRQPDFVERVVGMLQQTGIDPRKLKLELTESLVLDNVAEAIATMQRLKESGVQFSMDDFGTGYSSLAYLKKLPLDQLKIDQSFVSEIDTDPDDATIVQTIVAMAKNLDMEVIAEGVESELQRNFLIECGCLNFQGYLFGKPLPLAEFELLLQELAGRRKQVTPIRIGAGAQ